MEDLKKQKATGHAVGGGLLRAFFEESSEGLLAVDLTTGQVLDSNPSLLALTGLGRDEVVGESVAVISSLSIPEEFHRERKLDMNVLRVEGVHNDILLGQKEGPPRFTSVRVRHQKNISGSSPVALVAISDDTERQWLIRDLAAKHQSLDLAYKELSAAHENLKLSQERMAQTARLTALGELAAGLSHELGQPLTGVAGFAQEIADILKTQPRPKKFQIFKLAKNIEQQSRRMAKLLSQFRQFARTEKQKSSLDGTTSEPPKKIKILEVFSSVLNLFDRQLKNRGIKIETNFQSFMESGESLTVLGRALPLEQILINLLSNSRDAIGEKFKDLSGSGIIKIRLVSKSDSLEVFVSDNGAGVPEVYRTRIFDPFFTTKETGKGTGLGLSISYALAQKMGGSLELESSNLGEGAKFRWVIPKKFRETTPDSDLEIRKRMAS